MKNGIFEVNINKNDGNITRIINLNDTDKMNWCADSENWGAVYSYNLREYDKSKEKSVLPLDSFEEGEDYCKCVYKNEDIEVEVCRFFDEKEYLTERYTIKNLRTIDLFLNHGDISIALPLNDRYTNAEDCLVGKCNAHLWCASNCTYINALKMGPSDINLGLVLCSGSIKSYSVDGCKSNNRGVFLLNCDNIRLLPNEEYIVEWKLFWHKGNEDFYKKAKEFENYLHIEARHFTVFKNEKIRFTLSNKNAKVFFDGNEVSVKNGTVCFSPNRLGEHKFDIYYGDLYTYAEFYVSVPIEKLLKKRIDFIVNRQQYKRHGSSLDGAFLIYDNLEKQPVFNSIIRDHNACRERMGMAILIIRYLQSHKNKKFLNAINDFLDFLIREVVDTNTGEVYDGTKRDKQFVRLYNAPWITTVFTEMYFLTKDKTYLSYVQTILNYYYKNGGVRFYPNGLSMRRTVEAFKDANMTDAADSVLKQFISHIERFIENGESYPKHEVNFEQTIVSPAATYISEIAYLTNNKKYTDEAKWHIEVLKRFNGHQPSFHLNEIPIRYWDDYWFGKAALYGDTFPHYWSCLTARAFTAFYNCSGDVWCKEAAQRCIKDCLCLFNDKGEGSCAYVYPFTLNGNKGQFYDEWANDQDFALYFWLVVNNK